MIPLVVILFYVPYPWAESRGGDSVHRCGRSPTPWTATSRAGSARPRALGAFLDPVADKLMVAVALVLLVSHDPPELHYIRFNPQVLITLTAAVIVGREITISALREWMAEIGARGKVAVSSIGKFKTIFQMTGLSMMLFRSDVWFIPAFELGVYCLVAAAALTLWSMVVYLRAAWPELMRGRRNG